MLSSVSWSYLPLVIVLVLVLLSHAVGHYLLLVRPKGLGSESKLPRQLLLLLLSILSLALIIIVAPMPESTRNQILGFLGIVLSGIIALSSAPFVTNFMAAVMLRVTKPFTVGDFIRVGELYGKVSERGLFDTEIQTEFRELIAIPNATFVSQSVTVMRSSGVIVSTTISLGYDLSFAQSEPLMLEAAGKAGLSDPYIHIIGLQDSAVSYRVCGLLADVEGVLTARSELNRQLLNTLHEAGLEIVSPAITKHIHQSADIQIIPPGQSSPESGSRVKAEDIVFDKATEISRLEQAREQLQQEIKDDQNSKPASTGNAEALQNALADVELKLKALVNQP